ncbi:Iron transport multicopper oxidase FET3 [Dirofilaria immitis]
MLAIHRLEIFVSLITELRGAKLHRSTCQDREKLINLWSNINDRQLIPSKHQGNQYARYQSGLNLNTVGKKLFLDYPLLSTTITMKPQQTYISKWIVDNPTAFFWGLARWPYQVLRQFCASNVEEMVYFPTSQYYPC